MTAKLLIQPTTMMHAVSDHGVTTLIITQGDCRMELAMSSDRVRQFYGDVSEALTPAIHEEFAKAEERKAAVLAGRLEEVRELARWRASRELADAHSALTEALEKLDEPRRIADGWADTNAAFDEAMRKRESGE